ncbi:cytochrome P450 4e2-like [Musca domestica]|uniref:Cytochrome P450 4e2-like n=1 Tax=Musca domestica TaxID=7370 RepID=A0ABM3UMQ9_MUSDO|nr:cytochrome P450 4e2-like [Musca domestica]
MILLALLAILAYNEIKTAKIRKQVKHTAGEPTLPILGNLHQLGRKPTVTTNYLFDLFYKYNFGNLCIWLGYHLQYLVVDTKDVEFILSTNPLVNKSDIYKLLHPWLGEGLITSSGAKWQKHRKMITPSFNFNILNSIQDVMKTNSEKFIGKLREISRGDNIFDLQEVVNNLTLDVICETAMGVSINALDNPHSDFVLAVKL